MEVLQENVLATCSPARRFKALLANFRKLKTADTPPNDIAELEYPWQDVLHAVAGMCSVALPDMEEAAIFSSLTRAGSKAIILIAEHSTDAQKLKTSTSSSETESSSHTAATKPSTTVIEQCPGSSTGSGSIKTELEMSFQDIFSASEASESESVEEDDEFSEGRRKFLEACHSRLRQAPLTATGENYPGGAEDIVAGCGCFMRLSSRPKANAVQILLLAVRHRWRRAGLGSFLLHTMKDPAVVGYYNALLTFADHKAERFFTTHGFADDPILTAKYSEMVDHWENSNLMVYIPPFSDTNSSDCIAALSLCEDSFKSWRMSAINNYCEQLSLMQRLRHEVVLLHSKLESREADIRKLTQQLQQVQRDKFTMELEFSNYRKHTQRLLREATVDKAQEWLDSIQHTN